MHWQPPDERFRAAHAQARPSASPRLQLRANRPAVYPSRRGSRAGMHRRIRFRDSPLARPAGWPASTAPQRPVGSPALPRKEEWVLARSWLIAPPGSADPSRRRDDCIPRERSSRPPGADERNGDGGVVRFVIGQRALRRGSARHLRGARRDRLGSYTRKRRPRLDSPRAKCRGRCISKCGSSEWRRRPCPLPAVRAHRRAVRADRRTARRMKAGPECQPSPSR